LSYLIFLCCRQINRPFLHWAVVVTLALTPPGLAQEGEELALEELEAQALADPDDASLRFRLATARFESGDADGAIESFQAYTMLVAPERRSPAIVAMVQILILEGRYDAALTELERPELDPGEAAELRVVTLASAGRYGEARTALEEMAAIDPALAPRRAIYAELIDLAENDPGRLAGVTFDVVPADSLPGGSEWAVLANLAYGYNSNVVGLGEGVALPTDISSESSSVRRAIFDAYWRVRVDPETVASVGVQAAYDRYPDVSSLNADRYLVWADLSHKIGQEMLGTLRLTGDTYEQDGEMLRLRGAGRAGLTWRWHERWWTEAALTYAYSDFDNPSFAPFNRDGPLYAMELNQSWALPALGSVLTAGYGHDIQRTQGSDFDYDGNRLSLTSQSQLTAEMVVDLSAGVSWVDYLNPNSLTGFTQKRTDRISWLGARIGYSFTEGVEVFASWNVVDVDSNIAFYSFDRHETLGGLVLRF
jgi:tetratricopeptide (TPR) repeat protein